MYDSMTALSGFVTFFWVILVIYVLACPVFCMQAANSKGYSGWPWFFAGFFFWSARATRDVRHGAQGRDVPTMIHVFYAEP
jgi:hypothetical protein